MLRLQIINLKYTDIVMIVANFRILKGHSSSEVTLKNSNIKRESIQKVLPGSFGSTFFVRIL
jgi:hypothetical protein